MLKSLSRLIFKAPVGILTLKVLREEFVVVVESWPTRSPVKVTSIMLESRS
jgi:hypothetical protein